MPNDKANPAGRAMLDEIQQMIEGVRKDIAKSETSTGQKIDDLSIKLSARLEKAEGELTTLGIQVA